jgi:hypothetical protein
MATTSKATYTAPWPPRPGAPPRVGALGIPGIDARLVVDTRGRRADRDRCGVAVQRPLDGGVGLPARAANGAEHYGVGAVGMILTDAVVASLIALYGEATAFMRKVSV